MTPDEVKPIVRYGELMVMRDLRPVSAGIGYFIPASEVGRMLKAAMAERNIDKIVAWYLKADELEAMK